MTNHNACPTSARGERRAFTLTELLVVIAIIAVLAAMGSWGVMQALGTAKQSRIKLELDQLDVAFKTYKDKYGSYPPNLFNYLDPMNSQALRAHITRLFPRYDLSQLINDLKAAGVENGFRPDQQLVFWLSGFSPDPQHPFVTPGDPSNPTAVKGAQIENGVVKNANLKVAVPIFDFDVTRLASVRGPTASFSGSNGVVPSYFPPGSKMDADSGAPYLYWPAQGSDNYVYGGRPVLDPPMGSGFVGWNENLAGSPLIFTNAGPATPYGLDVNSDGAFVANVDKWANDDSYQIISAGADGKYGNSPAIRAQLRIFPTKIPFGADDDNVTNFCQKARLGDARP